MLENGNWELEFLKIIFVPSVFCKKTFAHILSVCNRGGEVGSQILSHERQKMSKCFDYQASHFSHENFLYLGNLRTSFKKDSQPLY